MINPHYHYVPVLRRIWVSLSASNTDHDQPPTSAEDEGHPSERNALKNKYIQNDN